MWCRSLVFAATLAAFTSAYNTPSFKDKTSEMRSFFEDQQQQADGRPPISQGLLLEWDPWQREEDAAMTEGGMPAYDQHQPSPIPSLGLGPAVEGPYNEADDIDHVRTHTYECTNRRYLFAHAYKCEHAIYHRSMRIS